MSAPVVENVAWLSQAHPTPWKVQRRKPGAMLRGAFPWEVVDAGGFTVALVDYEQSGNVLALAANSAAGQ